MSRSKLPLSDWSWDQIVLILGPVLLSIVLLGFYAAGFLDIAWPALLIVLLLINLAGDIAFALKSEWQVKRGRVPLCNDVTGARALVETEFTGGRGRYRGTVVLGGERWQAASRRRLEPGVRVAVQGRRGLVLEVSSDADSGTGDRDRCVEA